MSTEKIYSVEFMNYTNYMRDTVSDYSEHNDLSKTKYISVGKEPFLVKESNLDKFKHFGGGYRSITFVGMMEV